MPQDVFMPIKAIVSFFDILGYDSLVKKMINDSGFIKRFDALMYGITVDMLKKLKNLQLAALTNKPVDEVYFNKIVGTIKVRCIYDNIIFSLPLSDITFNSPEFDNNTTVLNCIETFFSFMAMFSTLFISKMGHLLRGGISADLHYESEHENYLFIFSEAHNKAVRLEEEAVYPRILLDDSLRLQLEEISYPYMDKFFYKDEDGRYCFDIYSILQIMDNRQNVLTDINKGITLNIESNSDNNKELIKLIYFVKYHNKKVSSDELNFPDLVINIDKFGSTK
jgi:hypothetical protein